MRYDVFLTLALLLPGSPETAPSPQINPPPQTYLHAPASALVPAPAPTQAPPKESLTAFDANRADLDWSSQGWRLTADGAALKDFGRRESDAHDALRLIRELRLNQRGIVGGPSPKLEYWLSDGRPPQAPPSGLRVQAMDAATMRVEQTQNQWVLRDDRRILFNFGGEESDAREALAVVRKYGFTHVGVVDPASPVMMVFFAEPGASSVAAQAMQPHAPETAAPVMPAVDPMSPAGRLLAQHPEVLGGPVVAPAIPPLRQAAISGNILSATSANPDRTPFDYRQVQLRQDHGSWMLAAGSFVLADFGGDEHAARLGLSATQYYHFTEQNQVGTAPDRFSYLLAAGQAPRGTMFGVDGQAFQPDRLEVRQVEGRWAVCGVATNRLSKWGGKGRRRAGAGGDPQVAVRPAVPPRHGGRQEHDVPGADAMRRRLALWIWRRASDLRYNRQRPLFNLLPRWRLLCRSCPWTASPTNNRVLETPAPDHGCAVARRRGLSARPQRGTCPGRRWRLSPRASGAADDRRPHWSAPERPAPARPGQGRGPFRGRRGRGLEATDGEADQAAEG